MVESLIIVPILKNSWKILKKNFLSFTVLFLSMVAFNYLNYIKDGYIQNLLTPAKYFISVAAFLINSYLLTLFMQMSLIAYFEKPVLRSLKIPARIFINKLATDLIVNAIIILGFIFFVVPGIIFVVKLQFSGYSVLDKKLSPLKAIAHSWEITKNQKLQLFYLLAILIILNLAAIYLFFVGVVIAYPIFSLSQAGAYYILTKNGHKNNKKG